ncbi:transcription termination factor Rho [Kribbella sindirgiensis]|uniref:Transcription termination factor Rho n=1 Tax=Kribbella sindirgiensis TaxID=1124744 RepID=A0A4R0IGM0_9ACTN|nr:transcription termination factor Rho [Kribbella sindirgiensis]TCC31204.1 transcription termination factor Rho [Kribbella sindirgiensis]
MTETVEASSGADAAATTATRRRKAGGGLEGMLLPELKQLAGTLGIKGTGALRKGQLIEAIKAAQAGGSAGSSAGGSTTARGGSKAKATQPTLDDAANEAVEAPAVKSAAPAKREGGSRRTRAAAQKDPQKDAAPDVALNGAAPEAAVEAPAAKVAQPETAAPNGTQSSAQAGAVERVETRTEERADDRGENQGRNRDRNRDNAREQNRDNTRDNPGRNRDGGQTREQNRDTNRDGQRDGNREQNRDGNRDNRDNQRNRQDRNDRQDQNDRGEEGEGRRRRRRGRDRDRTRDGQSTDRRDGGRDGGRDTGRTRGRGERYDTEPTISEDDVLVPAAGILDVLDNYAFVRTSGYLPGPNDVYVALSMVKRYGLRKGDAITGAVKQPQEGERKEKFNPLVRIDTVNGADPEIAKQRQDFNKLTPLYATERLRLETEPGVLTTRIVDIVSPIGKGQRGLIVSPPKAGKTMVLQALANAITTNNPEVHLMVVLVDERPEEVTDMQRTVKGEVIASTFDRPADDHTTVAELAIERAKRLVELGHDVVVLLDSITRLGRAYNIAAPASGRILSGGVDSSALYPPKRFFGAARNIEDGGSLTILATALIETGSKMDEVIFEEFKGTGNMELRLRREFADRRIFPAIDVVASGTRREELLMSKDETQVVWKLRRVLSALDGQAALELLIGKLKESKSNIEFLLQVNKTTPSTGTSHSTTNGD